MKDEDDDNRNADREGGNAAPELGPRRIVLVVIAWPALLSLLLLPLFWSLTLLFFLRLCAPRSLMAEFALLLAMHAKEKNDGGGNG